MKYMQASIHLQVLHLKHGVASMQTQDVSRHACVISFGQLIFFFQDTIENRVSTRCPHKDVLMLVGPRHSFYVSTVKKTLQASVGLDGIFGVDNLLSTPQSPSHVVLEWESVLVTPLLLLAHTFLTIMPLISMIVPISMHANLGLRI